MKKVEINNDSFKEFLEFEFKDFGSYAELVSCILLSVVLIVVYTLWIIVITLKIRKRVRKLRQLKANILESREEEERQKWNLYNEKTHLVKESYLLAICACEFCLTILWLSVQTYAILKRHLEKFQNTIVLSENLYITDNMAITSYEEPIVMLLRGIIWILLHIIVLQICSLMRYLIDRYLCRKTYNRRTILVYGVLSCVFIMLFFIKYTFFFRIFAFFALIFDLFLLLRYRTKLSLVLIGRVREIRQCYGNGRRYQYEYKKYISFRGFSFLFCLGMLITFLAVLTRLIMDLLTHHMYPCNGVSLLDFHKNNSWHTIFHILHRYIDLFSLFGPIIFFAPCVIYTLFLIISHCVTKFKKQPSFHDEIIKPLIDRYHNDIMN